MKRGLTGHFAPLSPRDAAYLYDERPGRREMLVACYVFDAAPTTPSCSGPDALRGWMRARLGAAPFFTRAVRFAPLHLDLPAWVPVDRVDLSEHVHLHRIEGGWPVLRGVLTEIAAAPIDLRRPPWELHAVTGGRFPDGPAAVTVIVLKVHHCAVDGMGLRDLEATLFAPDGAPVRGAARSPAHPAETAVRAALGSPLQSMRFVRGLRATRGGDTGEASPSAQGPAAPGGVPPAHPSRNRPATRFNRPVSGAPVFEIGLLPIADVREARSAAPGATVNDVLLSAVGGALRRFLDDAGERPDASLAALVPISLRLPDGASARARGLDADSANQLALGTVDLCTDIADPAERLAAVADSSAREKARWMAPEVRHARSRMDTAPAWLLAVRGWAARRGSGATAGAGPLRNTMVSNLPAPAGGPTFDGAPLRAEFGVLPVVDGDRVRHLFSTSGGRIILCVNADRDAVGDLAGYVDSVAREVDSLRRAAQLTRPR